MAIMKTTINLINFKVLFFHEVASSSLSMFFQPIADKIVPKKSTTISNIMYLAFLLSLITTPQS